MALTMLRIVERTRESTGKGKERTGNFKTNDWAHGVSGYSTLSVTQRHALSRTGLCKDDRTGQRITKRIRNRNLLEACIGEQKETYGVTNK